MSKIIYFVTACFAVGLIYSSIVHLINLTSYTSADLVLALLIASVVLKLSGDSIGKNSQEKPSL